MADRGSDAMETIGNTNNMKTTTSAAAAAGGAGGGVLDAAEISPRERAEHILSHTILDRVMKIGQRVLYGAKHDSLRAAGGGGSSSATATDGAAAPTRTAAARFSDLLQVHVLRLDDGGGVGPVRVRGALRRDPLCRVPSRPDAPHPGELGHRPRQVHQPPGAVQRL
jgi:hypothetical protein